MDDLERRERDLERRAERNRMAVSVAEAIEANYQRRIADRRSIRQRYWDLI